MFELVLLLLASSAMGRVAAADGKSGWLWGMVNVVVCILCLYIPLPFLRIGLGSVVTFVGMICYNAFAEK